MGSRRHAQCTLGARLFHVYGRSKKPGRQVAHFRWCRFLLAAIVMYDAMGVRRETGEQAKVLNRMISDWLSEDEDAPAYLAQNGRKLKEKVGHTPFEVLSGALLGILIAVIVPAP